MVLLDIWMPGLDGFQVLEEIRKDPTSEHLPVIMITAVPEVQGEKQGMALGALHYITKSWAPGVIEAAVRVALRSDPPNSIDARRRAAADSELSPELVDYQSDSVGAEHNGHPDRIGTAGRLTALESVLGGGLGAGSLTLVEGPNTSGKSIISQHLVYGALTQGRQTAYLTSEHTEQSFLEQMSSIGLDVSSYLHSNQIGVFSLPQPNPIGDSDDQLRDLAQNLREIHGNRDFIVIDAVSNHAETPVQRR